MMKKPLDILATIIEQKKAEVAQLTQQTTIAQLQQQCTMQTQPRDFTGAIQKKLAGGQSAVIAEIKKASPSKGIIREIFNPAEIAKHYQQGGATCLSVLTDQRFFQGNIEDLMAAKNACQLPILRKDFMISPYQIFQARAIGADCILLIVAALTDNELHTLHDISIDLGMAVLVESHNREELQRALTLATPLIGINNRDLHRFETSLNTTIDLLTDIPDDKVVISESGIHTKQDIHFLQQHHVNAFLIGEAFMRETDPGAALRHLMQ